MEQRKQGRGWNGHFLGFWARLNCENMPVIPAWIVRSNLNDPRRIPYLLVWKDERHGGEMVQLHRTCWILHRQRPWTLAHAQYVVSVYSLKAD